MTETDQEEQLHDDAGLAAVAIRGSSQGIISRKQHLESGDDDQGETEDEEVKRNCMMGVSEFRDSDFSDTDMEDDEEEKEQDDDDAKEASNDRMEEESSNEEKLVEFVCGGQMTKPEGILFRPTPVVAKLATHTEDSNEDDSSSESEEEEECLSDNARGASYSYMVNSNDELDASSSDESDDDEDEQVEQAVINDEEAAVDAAEQPSDEEEDEDDSSDEEDQVENEEAEAVEDDPEQSEVEEENESEESEAEMEQQEEEDDEDDYPVIDLAVEAQVTEPEDEGTDKLVSEQDQAEPEDEDYSALIGACVDDDKWTWSKQKRVLSSNTLAALNREAGRNAEEPKRIRSYSYPPPVRTEPPSMPELSLGVAAFETTPFLPRQSVIREASSTLSSDEEEDRMLSEELAETALDSGGDNSPIPLLTPPQSPRREDEVEWPSNLVVDSALMNTVTEIRPLSPASLQSLEMEEEERLKGQDTEASTLTPLLRSICVGLR